MNIVNPCKVLLFAGTMAISFGIRADGTLPFSLTGEKLPFVMSGNVVKGAAKTAIQLKLQQPHASSQLVDQEDLKPLCRDDENFYPAAGQVAVDGQTYTIQGVCARGQVDGQKQVLAVDREETNLLQLDGTFKQKTFKGQLRVNGEETAVPFELKPKTP